MNSLVFSHLLPEIRLTLSFSRQNVLFCSLNCTTVFILYLMERVLHKKFTIELIKNNFLSLVIHENEIIEAEDIHLIYKGYEQLIGENEYVVAVYSNPFSSISDEAKEIAARQYASEKRKKVAIISDNLAHVIIAKFFILWNKPKTQIKIFKSEQKAFQWLESIKP